MSNDSAADWTTRDKWGVPLAAKRTPAESRAHDEAQHTREASRWANHTEGK
jgi:hypothetical protein